jgi:hypothetical protein
MRHLRVNGRIILKYVINREDVRALADSIQ